MTKHAWLPEMYEVLERVIAKVDLTNKQSDDGERIYRAYMSLANDESRSPRAIAIAVRNIEQRAIGAKDQSLIDKCSYAAQVLEYFGKRQKAKNKVRLKQKPDEMTLNEVSALLGLKDTNRTKDLLAIGGVPVVGRLKNVRGRPKRLYKQEDVTAFIANEKAREEQLIAVLTAPRSILPEMGVTERERGIAALIDGLISPDEFRRRFPVAQ